MAGSPRGASILPRLSVKVRKWYLVCLEDGRPSGVSVDCVCMHIHECSSTHVHTTPTRILLPYYQQCRAALEALWERRREELSAEGVKGEVDFCRRMLAYLDERLR